MNPPESFDRGLLAARLAALRAEYGSGQQMLADLQARSTALREQLLRIHGAIQVLEELMEARPAPVPVANGRSDP